ncbi:19934_t:CDS:2, partial [Racocetra fulgida]
GSSMSSVNKESEAVMVLNDSLLLDVAQTSLEAESGLLFLEDVEQRNVWVKQYNEWCKVMSLMNKALAFCDINYVYLAKQVILKRAYVIRVADEDSWEVVSKIAIMDGSDLMTKLLESFKSSEVICFVCEEKRHYANEYSSKRHIGLLFQGGNTQPKMRDGGILEKGNIAILSSSEMVRKKDSFVFEKSYIAGKSTGSKALSFYKKRRTIAFVPGQ